MDKLQIYTPLIARILLAVLFVVGGIGKLGDVAGFAGYMASGGVPGFLAWPAIVFELALGASLILGYQARIMALLGAGFCVLAGILYHFVPADQMQMISFMKNLGIAGGLLMVFVHGAGPFAIDKK